MSFKKTAPIIFLTAMYFLCISIHNKVGNNLSQSLIDLLTGSFYSWATIYRYFTVFGLDRLCLNLERRDYDCFCLTIKLVIRK